MKKKIETRIVNYRNAICEILACIFDEKSPLDFALTLSISSN